MGLIRRFRERREHVSAPSDSTVRLFSGGYSSESASGKVVTPETAGTVAAFNAGVRCISETIALMPVFLYRELAAGGKTKAKEHPLYKLLHSRPHPQWTAFDFYEWQVQNLFYHGAAYTIIVRKAGHVDRLIPVDPRKMRAESVVLIEGQEPQLVFYYRQSPGVKEIPLFLGEEVMYWRGPTNDGVRGISFVKWMKETLGLSLATEEFGGRLFSAGAMMRGVLEHPKTIKKEGKEAVREAFERMNSGMGNAHKVAILEEGMVYRPASIAPDDCQFLETRQFQKGEIATALRLPPHKVGDLTHATFSNIEHQSIDFINDAIMPWVKRIESAMARDLLTDSEQETLKIEFEPRGLMRGDSKSRNEAYQTARYGGWLNGDEIRELENMEPMPDGKGQIYWQPVNMADAGTVPPPGEKQEKKEDPPAKEPAKREITKELRGHVWDLIYQAADRALVKETKAVTRAAEKYQKGGTLKEFVTWADDFYNQFAKEFTDGLIPAVRIGATLFEFSQCTPEIYTRGVVDKLIHESKNDLSTGGSPKWLLERVGIWDGRPAKLAQYILAELEGNENG